MSQNHVIDPTFFYDAIEEFSFNYTLYVVTGKSINDAGKTVTTFTTQSVRGSLQSQGTKLEQSLEGNTTTIEYNFYCKSLYRINIGDVLVYKNNYLMVDSVRDYDEFGCRSCTLKQIQLTAYRDLTDYVQYLNGGKIV